MKYAHQPNIIVWQEQVIVNIAPTSSPQHEAKQYDRHVEHVCKYYDQNGLTVLITQS